MEGNEALMTEQGRQLQPLRYELVKILAEGSYGKVILARDTLSQEQLAFKVFTMEVHEGEEGEGEDDEDDKHMKARRKYTEDEEEIKECSQMASTPSIRKKQGMLRHFFNEVQYLKKLQHKNIV